MKIIVMFCLMMSSALCFAHKDRTAFIEQREQSYASVKAYCNLYKDAIHKIRYSQNRPALHAMLKSVLEADDMASGDTVENHHEAKFDYLIDVIIHNTTLRYLTIVGWGNSPIPGWPRQMTWEEYHRTVCNRNVEEFRKLDGTSRSDWFQEQFLTVGTTIVDPVPASEIKWG